VEPVLGAKRGRSSADEGEAAWRPRDAGSPAAPQQKGVRSIKGKSRFRGVSWNNSSNAWRAILVHRGQHSHLGLFRDEEEAARAWDREALRIK
jgi:hypothetical protein